MPERRPMIRGAFNSWQDQFMSHGRKPVIFDILAPDRETSILPEDLFLVLYVNPTSMKFSYTKAIIRIQTLGGWVEQHWGDAVEEISLDFATGGFMRLTSGLSNKTGTGLLESEQARKGRRETIQYDRYLDLLALFKSNGAVYDSRGRIASQGYIRITFDGGVYIGWFENMSVDDNVSRPFQFAITSNFKIDEEIMVWRSTVKSGSDDALGFGPSPPLAQEPIFESFFQPRGTS